MTTARTITKSCNGCKKEVALVDFHFRSKYRGKIVVPTEPAHVISECKTCMRERGKTQNRLSPHETRTASEMMFIEYLASRGVPALPGKAVQFADVDIVAYGHIWVEVKYSTLDYSHNAKRFRWSFSPKQVERGVYGHIIALICDYGERQTYHLFPWDAKYFYNEDNKPKTGINFVPGQMEAVKHKRRHILTQPVMDLAQDRTSLISTYLTRIHHALCEGKRPERERPFSR